MYNFCLSLIKTKDQVLLSPPDQCPTHLSPKWHGPCKVILVTPTATQIKGLPLCIHLSHLKPITAPLRTHPSSYTATLTGSCSVKFQRTPRSTALSQFQKNKALPHNCTLPDWESNMLSFLTPLPSPG